MPTEGAVLAGYRDARCVCSLPIAAGYAGDVNRNIRPILTTKARRKKLGRQLASLTRGRGSIAVSSEPGREFSPRTARVPGSATDAGSCGGHRDVPSSFTTGRDDDPRARKLLRA